MAKSLKKKRTITIEFDDPITDEQYVDIANALFSVLMIAPAESKVTVEDQNNLINNRSVAHHWEAV